MGKVNISTLERAMRIEVESIAGMYDIYVSRAEKNRIARSLVFDKCNDDIWERLNERILEYIDKD